MSLTAAGAIHLVLTPEHFEEQAVYGIFFLVAALFQIVLAQLLVLRPGPRVIRAGAYGNAALLAIWIVTRVVAPPLGESPEPVTFWGVLAKGLELTALFLLLMLLPPAAPREAGRVGLARPRVAWGWALGIGTGFTLLFMFASGSLTYVPGSMPPLPVTIDPWQGPSLVRPWVEGPLTSHLYLSASWSTLVFAVLAGGLLGAATGLQVGLSQVAPSGAPGRGGYLAISPALVAVPSCCGVPLVAFLGTSILPVLVWATPWLLLATTAGLAAYVFVLGRQWRVLARATSSPGARGV
jgi:hypothetical protein